MDSARKEDSPSALRTSAVSILGLALGGAAFLLDFFSEKPATVIPWALVSLAVIAGSSLTPIPGCFVVRFRGVPAQGYTYALAHSTEIDPRFYFAGRLNREPSDVWAKIVGVGTDTAGLDKTFHFSIVMIESEWVDYLIRTTPPTAEEPEPSWWSSSGLPPHSFLVGQFDIHRDSNPTPGCPKL